MRVGLAWHVGMFFSATCCFFWSDVPCWEAEQEAEALKPEENGGDDKVGSKHFHLLRRLSMAQLPKANRPFDLLVFQVWPIFSQGHKRYNLLLPGPLGK